LDGTLERDGTPGAGLDAGHGTGPRGSVGVTRPGGHPDATARSGSGTVRVVTLDQAIAEARAELDSYERTYGVPSDRLAEAFVDATGELRETGQYVRWMSTLERWRALTVRAAV
jgi:hypothetical protein